MKLLILTCLVCLLLGSSCGSDDALQEITRTPPTTTPIPLPGSTAREQSRNDLINEAIRLAAAGCPGIDERLSGPPTRVLVALTNSAASGRLIKPEAELQSESGPGAIGAVTVWVVVVEGLSVPTFGDDPWDGANVRSFAFVLNFFIPEFTGCVVRDAPMPTKYRDPLGGAFDFEVLLEGRP